MRSATDTSAIQVVNAARPTLTETMATISAEAVAITPTGLRRAMSTAASAGSGAPTIHRLRCLTTGAGLAATAAT